MNRYAAQVPGTLDALCQLSWRLAVDNQVLVIGDKGMRGDVLLGQMDNYEHAGYAVSGNWISWEPHSYLSVQAESERPADAVLRTPEV